MPDARKGLKRHGMRAYIVHGPAADYVIQRDRPWRFLVRNAIFANIYGDFMAVRFHRLFDARAWAEKQAGL